MTDLGKIADGAKNFACMLYREQPGALIPTPFSDALHFVWDAFCGDPPRDPSNLPPPPTPQFGGGQCQCALYEITVRFRLSSYPEIVSRQSRRIWGALGGLGYAITGREQMLGIYCYGREDDGCQSTARLVNVYTQGNYPNVEFIEGVIEIVTRVGRNDNCGDPPPSFPPRQQPPNGYTSPPTAITFNDNSVNNYTYNFKPPVAPPPGANFFPPVVINFNSANANFKIPISFNFNGDINFGGGGGGFTDSDRNNINNINNTTNNLNNSVNNVSATTNKTNNIVNNFINTVNNQPPNPTDYNPPKPPVLPGVHQVDYLAAVEVTLTAIPVNVRSQEGNAAPDVYYAGWFEFTRAGKALPRQNIHFQQGVFVAPTGVDGYAFTLYSGVQGTAVAITKKEKT